MIHLDTSFLVDALRESAAGDDGPAKYLLSGLRDEELAISVHVACELLAGAELSKRPDREREAVFELCAAFRTAFPDERFAPTYARLLAGLERAGRRAAVMDLLIATAAVVDRSPLVTRDPSGFERVPDLDLITY